jgi:hypothetical protein
VLFGHIGESERYSAVRAVKAAFDPSGYLDPAILFSSVVPARAGPTRKLGNAKCSKNPAVGGFRVCSPGS